MLLQTQKLISHTRAALFDTTTPPQAYDGEVITSSEIHEVLTKNYDILDSGVSNWAGNTAHILVYLFNPASRQHCEVCTSQFPFLPPSETCLNGCIN